MQIVAHSRDGRLEWADRPVEPVLASSEPPHLHRWRNVALAVTVVLYLLFNWGFQQVRVPPGGGFALPIGEIVLIAFLLTLNPARVLGKLAWTVPLWPFLTWWAFGLSRAFYDGAVHGMWAIRDAAHVIESLFLLVGFVLAAHPKSLERFFLWLPRLLFVGTAYALLYPLAWEIQALSPKLVTQHGHLAPIFGVMANSAYFGIITAAYLVLFHGNRFAANLLAALILGAMIAMYQARTITR